MQELTGVVRAVTEAWTVEAGVVALVHFLGCVALHEQVDGHDARTLGEGERARERGTERERERRTDGPKEGQKERQTDRQTDDKG